MSTIRIEYSPDGGTKWTRLAEKVDATAGSFTWTVPDIASTNCLVRIVDEQDANRVDVSANAFSIVSKKYLELTTPGGSES